MACEKQSDIAPLERGTLLDLVPPRCHFPSVLQRELRSSARLSRPWCSAAGIRANSGVVARQRPSGLQHRQRVTPTAGERGSQSGSGFANRQN